MAQLRPPRPSLPHYPLRRPRRLHRPPQLPPRPLHNLHRQRALFPDRLPIPLRRPPVPLRAPLARLHPLILCAHPLRPPRQRRQRRNGLFSSLCHDGLVPQPRPGRLPYGPPSLFSSPPLPQNLSFSQKLTPGINSYHPPIFPFLVSNAPPHKPHRPHPHNKLRSLLQNQPGHSVRHTRRQALHTQLAGPFLFYRRERTCLDVGAE